MRRPDLSDLPFASLDVTAAGESDGPELARLLSAAFEGGWDSERVGRELLSDPTVFRTLVIRDNDAIVATASARVLPVDYPGAGYVHWVASDPVRRGQGLGFAVTVAVLREFCAAQLSEAVLETDDQRLNAIRVYLGLGFIPQYRDESHQPRWSKIFSALQRESRMSRGARPSGLSASDASEGTAR